MAELDPSQQRAVDLACTAPFAVITGGPGVGKSTCLRVALDRLDASGELYALAAPTGKAAKRLTEATGRPASTLHRLLGIGHGGARTSDDGPLDLDAVIVDEASMLDVELAGTLMQSVRASTRIVLVGDANQLPSVGPGRVLGDIVDADMVPIVRLTTVHRAAAQSWVCRNAPRVLVGEALELEARDDFRFFEVDTDRDAARTVADLVDMEPYRGAQVLTPQRTTACGVEALNLALQTKLNPPGPAEWKIGETVLRVGDRVIQTANNYKIGVFNGEVGTVESAADKLVVDFGDRRVAYSKLEAVGLDLAYALTVHKSQGSEFPWVVVVVHSAHTYMLTRQLFYTAITRAKKGVVIVGNRKGLEVATSARMPPRRQTGLTERMRAELGLAPESNDANAPPDEAAHEEGEYASWQR